MKCNVNKGTKRYIWIRLRRRETNRHDDEGSKTEVLRRNCDSSFTLRFLHCLIASRRRDDCIAYVSHSLSYTSQRDEGGGDPRSIAEK